MDIYEIIECLGKISEEIYKTYGIEYGCLVAGKERITTIYKRIPERHYPLFY